MRRRMGSPGGSLARPDTAARRDRGVAGGSSSGAASAGGGTPPPFLAGLLALTAFLALGVGAPAPALAQGGAQAPRAAERPVPPRPPVPVSVAGVPWTLQGLATHSPAPGWLGLRLVTELQVGSRVGVGGAGPPMILHRGVAQQAFGEGAGGPPRVRVEEVVAGGPAQRAGVRAGDHLLRVNGADAFQALDQGALVALQPGDRVRLTLARGNQELEVPVLAQLRPEYEASLRARETAMVRADSVRAVVAVQVERALEDLASGRVQSFQSREEALAERRGSVVQLRRVPDVEVAGEGRVVATLHRPSFQLDSLARLRGDPGASPPASAPPPGVTMLRFRGAGPSGPESSAVTLRFFGDRTLLGAQVTPLNEGLATYFGVHQGVLVTEVLEGAPAAAGGVRAGDVIVGVVWRTGRAEPVTEVAALRAAVEAGWESPPLTLRIVREGRSLNVGIPTRR
jgi:hypothetical protein